MTFKKSLFVLLFCAGFSGFAFAGFDEGKKAYDSKDWVGAISNLRPEAEAGDARSMVLLGNMYAEGYGVEKDPVEAFQLYYKAAKLNNLDAMVTVATMYQQGLGVDASTPRAISWFQRAAMMGSQTGAFFYGIHLFQGSKGETFDIKPDHKQAYKWFLIAATGKNKQIADASRQLSLNLAEQITAEDKSAGESEAAVFIPADPAKLPAAE